MLESCQDHKQATKGSENVSNEDFQEKEKLLPNNFWFSSRKQSVPLITFHVRIINNC